MHPLKARLLRRRDHGPPVAIELDGETVIGRSSSCTIQEPHAGISSQHCRLYPDGESWSIVDLSSRNGTFVNEVRIREATVLRPGDVIRCGPAGVWEAELQLEVPARLPAAALLTARAQGVVPGRAPTAIVPREAAPPARERERERVIDQLRDRIGELVGELISANARVAAAEERARGARADEVARLTHEVRRLEDLLGQRDRGLQKRTAEMATARARAEELASRLAEAEQAVSVLRKKCDAQEASLAQAEVERRELAAMHLRVTRECDRLDALARAQQRQLDVAKLELDKLRGRLSGG